MALCLYPSRVASSPARSQIDEARSHHKRAMIFSVSKRQHRKQRDTTPRANSAAQPDTVLRHPVYFKDAYGRRPTESEVRESICRFARKPTFLLLARNNALLSFYQRGRDDRFLLVQQFLFDGLLDEQTRIAVAKTLPRGGSPERLVFHRKQMLLLMKFVLLYSSDSGSLDPSSDLLARYELGKLCLMVNDLLVTPDQEAALTSADGGKEEWERVHNELYSQLIPGAELASVPDVYSALARSDEYLAIFERESRKVPFSGGLNLLERFQELKQFDLRRYLKLMLGAHSVYAEHAEDPRSFIVAPRHFNLAKDTLFSKMKVSEAEVGAFFDSAAITIIDLAAEIEPPSEEGDIRFIHDVIPLRKHPLVYIRDEMDVASLLDFHFLGDKICQGLYHTVLKGLLGEEPDHNNFLTYWGDVFEIYVNDRLRETFPSKTRKLFCSPMFDFNKKGFQAFDSALALGSDLVVFEEKGKYLAVPAKYGGDRDQLRNELDARFGKAVRQLARNLEMVFHRDAAKRKTFSEYNSDQEAINTFDLARINRVRRVYPVLVVQDFSLEFGFANWNLRDALSEEIGRADLAPGLVKPLTVMTVEDLEYTLPYVRQVPLQNILDYHARKLEPIVTFKYIFNIYLRRRGIKPSLKNEWVERRVHHILDSMRGMFHDLD